MEHETQSRPVDASPGEDQPTSSGAVDPHSSDADVASERDLSWAFLGDDGLRSGWSALLFVSLYFLISPFLDAIAVTLVPSLAQRGFGAFHELVTELIPVTVILVAGLLMARLEHRRLADYFLAGPRPAQHFLVGLASGFAALSVLIGALALGGWIRFGHAALHGAPALKYGAIWAGAFLLVGLFEEGSFRCYLLFTLTRGVNFWWALAAVAGLCALLLLSRDPNGSGGVFAVALLGLVPCWLVHRSRSASSSFWQAAWATSTAFAYFHTNNDGENWIGIFAAALIGFVFCVSVWVTRSAWWAIGCHAAWDWAETFFYGTPDSGLVAQGHLLTTRPVGNVLWSGGADGPEGSLIVAPVILLLLAGLLAVHLRRRGLRERSESDAPAHFSA
jgi:membrane protease YdiL (CAAX protease family)